MDPLFTSTLRPDDLGLGDNETAGDFRAQIAANNTGARRLLALLERQGFDDAIAYIDELIRYTEQRTRAEIRSI